MRVWPDGAPPARKISDWRSAEVNALEWMRWLGHRDARATQPGADGGIDVIAAGAFAQVKLYGKPIPVTLMRQLHGARANRPGTLYFFANNGYTAKAAEFAEMVGMAAFRYSTASGLITAESSAARTIFNAAADQAADSSRPSARASAPFQSGRESTPKPAAPKQSAGPRGENRSRARKEFRQPSATRAEASLPAVEYLPFDDRDADHPYADLRSVLRRKREARAERPEPTPRRHNGRRLGKPSRRDGPVETPDQPEPSPAGCLATGGFVAAAAAACCGGTRFGNEPPLWLLVCGTAALLVAVTATVVAVIPHKARTKAEPEPDGG
ncbi:restriction endonuclease [Micromonospora purpureochromogenes]|uniref:restriction endonuclease n=1 Tax=Micromonospora purpureochromogenes TaxID=47872 RepID=UPI00332215E9